MVDMVWEKTWLHSAVQRPRFRKFYGFTLLWGIWLDHLQPSCRKMKREWAETYTGVFQAWPSSDRHHFNPYYVSWNLVIWPGGFAEETRRSRTFRLSSLPPFRMISYDFIGIIKDPGMPPHILLWHLIPCFSSNQGWMATLISVKWDLKILSVM